MFGKKAKVKESKIWRRQRTVKESDPYGFKMQRRGEQRAKIRFGDGWKD
jgi:hypothetical protein